jgi:hypothetical protein
LGYLAAGSAVGGAAIREVLAVREARPCSKSGVALLLVLVAFVVAKYLGTLNPWKLTHWAFGYDLGFVKRALAGTLLQWALPGGIVTREAVVAVSLGICGAFVLALATLAFPLFVDPARRRSLLVAVAAFLAPGLGFLLADLGRFDVLNLLLSLLAILFAERLGRFHYLLFVAVATVQMLIHEAALVLSVPVLFVAYLRSNGRLRALANRARWPELGMRVAPVVLLFGALVVFARSDLTLPDLLARIASRTDFEPAPRSTLVLLRSLDSHLGQVAGLRGAPGADPGTRPVLGSGDLLSLWLILGVAVLQQVLAHVSFRTLDRERRLPVWCALHLCFAAPFVMLLVGVDWPRWVALASAQCAVLMLLFARDLSDEGERDESRGFVVLVLSFVVVASGSSYRMLGARFGMTVSPQTNVLGWLQDMEKSDAWYEPFLRADVR